jgi:hypothetical protein
MPIDATNVRKEGNSLIVEYPKLARLTKSLPPRMGWRGWVEGLFDMVLALNEDTKRADLDLAVHLDSQERRIDTVVENRSKDLKTINQNFTTHRELIDGFTELFRNQQAEIDGLWKVVNRQKAQIEMLTKLDTPEGEV